MSVQPNTEMAENTIILPKPEFSASDETSISITNSFPTSAALSQALQQNRVRLQYKQPHEPWEQAKDVVMTPGTENSKKSGQTTVELLFSSVCMEDLNPGTPYCVRFVVVGEDNGVIQTGPDTVYDTAPVDCGPKKKSCAIS